MEGVLGMGEHTRESGGPGRGGARRVDQKELCIKNAIENPVALSTTINLTIEIRYYYSQSQMTAVH